MSEREYTEADVERVARTLALANINGRWWSAAEWDGIMPDRYKEPFYAAARAVITALKDQ